ncbi:Kr-h1 family protein [Megaselia abdita]
MVYYTAPTILQKPTEQLIHHQLPQQHHQQLNEMLFQHQIPLDSKQMVPSNSSLQRLSDGTVVITTQSKAAHNYSTSLMKLESPQQQQTVSTTTMLPTKKTPMKQQFKCETCNMMFGSKSAHTSHMKTHSKTATNVSLPVPNTIPALPQITPNMNPSAGGDPYQCNVCQKTFAVPARLIRHYRTHTGERPFKCDFCDKMFSVKENLQVHRRIHTKERPYKCEVCGRAFEHSGKLHRHMRIHTGERPHKCSVCGKTFIQSGQLVIHMRTHTGEKPYKCPVEKCGKGFTCSKQLKVHSRTHTGEKPYHCDICKRDFGYNHVLKLHRVQHYGSKCYKCTICDETFKNKKEMEAHIKGHANDEDDGDSTSGPSSQKPSSTSSIYSSPSASSSPSAAGSPSPSINLETDQSIDSGVSTLQSTSSSVGPSAVTFATNDYNDHYVYNLSANGAGHSSYESPSRPTINPALLAAATIASARADEEAGRFDAGKELDIAEYYMKVAGRDIAGSPNEIIMEAGDDQAMSLDALEDLRRKGYFKPAPVTEFRSSLHHNDIVRQVEAAIGLSPPRSSSTESLDRSSSPESDSMMMAERDVMTLPLRKRKLYMSDSHPSESQSQSMRMSSVIQFAKAS